MEKRLPPIVWIFSGGGAWVQELRCWEGLLPGLLGEEALEEGLGLGGGEEEEGSAGGGGGGLEGLGGGVFGWSFSVRHCYFGRLSFHLFSLELWSVVKGLKRGGTTTFQSSRSFQVTIYLLVCLLRKTRRFPSSRTSLHSSRKKASDASNKPARKH